MNKWAGGCARHWPRITQYGLQVHVKRALEKVSCRLMKGKNCIDHCIPSTNRSDIHLTTHSLLTKQREKNSHYVSKRKPYKEVMLQVSLEEWVEFMKG